MRCFADTSFLLALLAYDGHSRAAGRWIAKYSETPITSDLVVFEAFNALRSLHLRGIIDAEEHKESRLILNTLLRRQVLLKYPFRTRLLTAEAHRLLDHFSPGLPHGTLDVLHVAAAKLLKADSLATFDKNQRALAKEVGLKVVP